MLLAASLSDSFVAIGYGPNKHNVNPRKITGPKFGSPLCMKFSDIKQGSAIPMSSTISFSLFHEDKSSSTWVPSSGKCTPVLGAFQLNDPEQSGEIDILVDADATATVIGPTCIRQGSTRMKASPTRVVGFGGTRIADTMVPLEVALQRSASPKDSHADPNIKMTGLALVAPIGTEKLILGTDTLHRIAAL